MRPTDPIQISQVEDFPTAAFAACDFSFDISQAIAIPYDDPRQLHPVPSRRKDYGGDPADWEGAAPGSTALLLARAHGHAAGHGWRCEIWHGMGDPSRHPFGRRRPGSGRAGWTATG